MKDVIKMKTYCIFDGKYGVLCYGEENVVPQPLFFGKREGEFVIKILNKYISGGYRIVEQL